jgi:hypothetical protein
MCKLKRSYRVIFILHCRPEWGFAAVYIFPSESISLAPRCESKLLGLKLPESGEALIWEVLDRSKYSVALHADGKNRSDAKQ